MKASIVAYSWTGNTAACAAALGNTLGVEPFLLIEEKERKSNEGFARGGTQASFGMKTKLKALPDISGADTVVLGMPVWAGTTPPAINAYLSACDLTGKQVFAFVTEASANVPARLEKKLRKLTANKGGAFQHLFVLSVPSTMKMTVGEAQPHADRWAERMAEINK